MTVEGRVLSPEAEKTGEWVVAIYESTGSLLAVHGPYPSAGEAQRAADRRQARDRADIYPLFHPDHVGRD